MFKVSTGAGNNNGFVYLFVDGVLVGSKTDMDNDTKDWDFAWFGQTGQNSTTFGGSYYMDTIKVDPVGALFVDKLAALSGSYGLAVPVMDTNCTLTM